MSDQKPKYPQIKVRMRRGRRDRMALICHAMRIGGLGSDEILEFRQQWIRATQTGKDHNDLIRETVTLNLVEPTA